MFDTLLSLGAPVAWNLAGGYQREPDGSIPRVLEIHLNKARAAIRALAARQADRDRQDRLRSECASDGW